MLCRGISVVVGALDWKTPSSCHFDWYFFSIAMRVSLFSVCGLLSVKSEGMLGMRGTYAFQFFSFGDGGLLQCLSGCFNCCHNCGIVFEKVLQLFSKFFVL